MNLLTLLDMVAHGPGNGVALGTAERGSTGEQLRDQAHAGAGFAVFDELPHSPTGKILRRELVSQALDSRR